jgi:hypothetical protein
MMPNPKKQPDYDPEWEQERPLWEAYKRGEFTDDDLIDLDAFIDSVPGLREEFEKLQREKEHSGEDG